MIEGIIHFHKNNAGYTIKFKHEYFDKTVTLYIKHNGINAKETKTWLCQYVTFLINSSLAVQ